MIYYAEVPENAVHESALETGSRTVYEYPRSRNFAVSPKISETRLHRETGSFMPGPL